MKTVIAYLMLTALPVLAWAADENFAGGYALAKEKGCLECHALDYTGMGPPFRAIAAHYRLDAEARKRLPYLIRGGSVGHWSDRVPMWPQAPLSVDEVRQLVDWVLSQ